MATKVYGSDKPSVFIRIGKSLIKTEFINGRYSTGNRLFQQAVENSEYFKNGIIWLI